MAGIRIIDKIMPKNDGFTGLCDADQVIGGSDVPLLAGDKVKLESDGSSYLTYNSSSDYVEIHAGGVKRIEL